MKQISKVETRPLLVRLGTYFIHEEAETTRINLYKAILFSILHNEGGPATPNEIKEKMVEFLGVEPDIEILNEVAANLVETNKLKLHDKKLSLTQYSLKPLDDLIGRFKDLEKKTIEIFSDKFKQNPKQGSILFYRKMANVFSELGANAILFLLGKAKQEIDFLSETEFLNVLKDMVNDDNELLDFIYPLASSYILVNILNLDPDCRELAEGLIKKRIIYLDTNMLLSFIANARGISELRKILGEDDHGSIKVFPTTIREYKKLCEIWKEDITKAQSLDRIKKFSGIIDDDIIKFWKMAQNLTPMSISDYLTLISRVDIYLERLQIDIDLENEDDLAEQERFSEDWYNIKDVTNIVKKYSFRKTERTAYHDAFALLKVQELRRNQSSDVMGPQIWFLTRDSSLRKVEAELGFTVQSSVFIEELTSILSTFISPKSTYKDKRDLFFNLLSSTLPSITSNIKLDHFLQLEGSWMDDPILKPEDLCRIFGEERVIKILSKSKKENIPVNTSELDLAITPILNELRAVRVDSEKEIASLKDREMQSEEEKQILQAQFNNLQESHEKNALKTNTRVTILEKEKLATKEENERKYALYHLAIWILLLIFSIIISYAFITTDLIPLTGIPIIYVVTTFILINILGYDPKKRFNALRRK